MASDSLQQKLRDILLGPTSTDEAVQLVIQAFQSEGWMNVLELEVQAEEARQRFKLMTGAEFYDRFKAELGEPQKFVGYGYDSVGYDEDDVMEAAKRASGLSE